MFSKETMSLERLQFEHAAWASRNFPDNTPAQAIMGLCEELGELAHAQLKGEQNIRGDQWDNKVDAVGDIVIYLAHYCTLSGINLGYAVEQTWRKVSQRDWVADPVGGDGTNEPQNNLS